MTAFDVSAATASRKISRISLSVFRRSRDLPQPFVSQQKYSLSYFGNNLHQKWLFVSPQDTAAHLIGVVIYLRDAMGVVRLNVSSEDTAFTIFETLDLGPGIWGMLVKNFAMCDPVHIRRACLALF
jgi:hypothetical protein